MPLLFTNATLSVARLSGSAYASVPGLSAVQAFVEDDPKGGAIKLLGTAQQMELTLKWNPLYDSNGNPVPSLQVGDRVTGWPGTTAALYVERTAYRSGIPGLDYWVGKAIGLPSLCSIVQQSLTSVGFGGSTITATTVATNVPCSLVAAAGGIQEGVQEGRLTATSDFLITVPLGTPVRVTDTVQFGSTAYEVRSVFTDPAATSWAILLFCGRIT